MNPRSNRLKLLFLITVLLPGIGLALVGASAIQEEQRLLDGRRAQRARDLATSLQTGLRELALQRAKRSHVRLREAVGADGDLEAVSREQQGVLVVDGGLNQVAPRRPWVGSEPDLQPLPSELVEVVAHEDAGRLTEALASLRALPRPLARLAVVRNVRARVLLKLGRFEEALQEDRWLKTRPASGGLPLAWIAMEREAECLLRLKKRYQAQEAVDASLRRILEAQGGTPGATWSALSRLHAIGRELSVFGGLLERARARMKEARVAAEVRALGTLAEGEGLTALAPRFLLAPLRVEPHGWLIVGPALRAQEGTLRAALVLPAARLEELLTQVARQQLGPDRADFRIELVRSAARMIELLPGSPLGLRIEPVESDFASALAQRRTLQRVTLLGFLLLVVVVGSLVTYRAVQRSTELAQVRADFAASVTHELRTPVTSIRAMAEILSLGKVANPERQQEYYSAIAEESQRLGRLIEDVLDVSRVERDGFKVELERAAPADVIREMLEAWRVSAASKGWPVAFSAEGQLPKVLIDARLLQRALENLLVNAVKYGGEMPEIAVAVRSDGHKGVEVAVSDNGPGIDLDEQERILRPFERGRASESGGRKPGAGLGLAIVKGILQAHQGRLEIRSEPGRGSTFVMWLPAAAGGLTRS